jgi:hypothetical protein
LDVIPVPTKATLVFHWRIGRDAVPSEENQILPNGTHASTQFIVVMDAVLPWASSQDEPQKQWVKKSPLNLKNCTNIQFLNKTSMLSKKEFHREEL